MVKSFLAFLWLVSTVLRVKPLFLDFSWDAVRSLETSEGPKDGRASADISSQSILSRSSAYFRFVLKDTRVTSSIWKVRWYTENGGQGIPNSDMRCLVQGE